MDSFIYKEKGNSVQIFLENSELYGDVTNVEEGFENKDEEKMIDINNEDLSFRTYEGSVISSPSKSVSKIYETKGKSISVNIRKGI